MYTVRDYLKPNIPILIRCAVALMLTVGAVFLTALMFVALYWIGGLLVGLGFSAVAVFGIAAIVMFVGCYMLASKLPDTKTTYHKEFISLLLLPVLWVAACVVASFVAAPPTAPPRHISTAK